MSFEFSLNEIVWAKIRGHPWWPAIIKSVIPDSKENKFKIDFIGDNSHATLPVSKLANFQKYLREKSKTKKSKLIDSIKKAKEMYESRRDKDGSKKPTEKTENTNIFDGIL
jgi:hypothetical protein